MTELQDLVARKLFESFGTGETDEVRAPWRQAKYLIVANEVIKIVQTDCVTKTDNK
jgi:hypothetical protein